MGFTLAYGDRRSELVLELQERRSTYKTTCCTVSSDLRTSCARYNYLIGLRFLRYLLLPSRAFDESAVGPG